MAMKKQYKVTEYVTYPDGSAQQATLYVGFDQDMASERLKDAVKLAVAAVVEDPNVGIESGFEVTNFFVKKDGRAIQTGARVGGIDEGNQWQVDIESTWVEIEGSPDADGVVTSGKTFAEEAQQDAERQAERRRKDKRK